MLDMTLTRGLHDDPFTATYSTPLLHTIPPVWGVVDWNNRTNVPLMLVAVMEIHTLLDVLEKPIMNAGAMHEQ